MNWQIVGHEWAVALLRQSLSTGRTAHAYLFSGPPQIGKTRLALRLAQALNCTQPDAPCGQCPSCRKIERHVHPDVHLLEGDGEGGKIKIEQIRELQREAVLAPYEGAKRVFILRRLDLASIEAANSLLKTLEEPPAHVVLILTAVDADALPATVVSRCQRLDLRPVAQRKIEAALCDEGVVSGRARLLARLSGGRVGWAFQAGQGGELLEQRDRDLDSLLNLLASNRVDRLNFAWEASRDSVALQRLLETWTVWWRDLLLIRSQAEDGIVNFDRRKQLRALAAVGDTCQVWAALKDLQDTAAQVAANVNARLALESLLLKFPHWSPLPGD